MRNERPVTYGWDIGGAHLKCVRLDEGGRLTAAYEIACPLWRGIDELRIAFARVLEHDRDEAAQHAVSMTGELCDNFGSRAAGVAAILQVVTEILGSAATRVFAGSAGWYAPDRIDQSRAPSVASANWLALGQTVAGRHGNALLIDVGSTTTDIIPIVRGAVASRGFTDAARLEHEELIYSGVVRTPLMAICDRVPFGGDWQRIAAEYFANMADVYRVIGELPEDADLHDTADGADKSIDASSRRIYRMLGRDFDPDVNDPQPVARYFAYRQFITLQTAVIRIVSGMPAPCEIVVAAGVGSFLVERLARFNGLRCVDFASLFEHDGVTSEAVAAAAPAAALAVLRQAL